MKRLKLFYVKEQYICYLRKFEHKIRKSKFSTTILRSGNF